MLNVIDPNQDPRGPRIAGSATRHEDLWAVANDCVSLPLAGNRLELAKRGYATGRIELTRAARLNKGGGASPKAGDLVLARVSQLGHHTRIESPQGRRVTLFVGDEVLLCYGARYASDQFEALVPGDLEPCNMVAAGGVAGRCVNRHSRTREPTEIEPIGLVADAAGRVLNLLDFARPNQPAPTHRPLTIAVLGTSMNAGKTTTATALARGLAAQGRTVGALKVTGTGAGGDRWAYVDAGAHRVLDFTDFGYATTYQIPVSTTEGILAVGVNDLVHDGCDAIVLEVADGLFFSETAELVCSATFRSRVDGIVLAARDGMGAVAGNQWLTDRALSPWAVAGCFTSSPLAVRETADMLSAPVVSLNELSQGGWMPSRMQRAAATSP